MAERWTTYEAGWILERLKLGEAKVMVHNEEAMNEACKQRGRQLQAAKLWLPPTVNLTQTDMPASHKKPGMGNERRLLLVLHLN